MSTHDDFNERLQRLRDSGHRLPSDPRPKAQRRPGRGREIAGNLGYVGSLVGAFVLGLAAVFAARYILFHIAEGSHDQAPTELDMIVMGAVSIGAVFLIGQVFQMKSAEHRGLQAAGVIVAICMFHNLSHWAPRPMAMAFSPEYVAVVQGRTPANSVWYRGFYFVFADDVTPGDDAFPNAEGVENALPTRLRMESEK